MILFHFLAFHQLIKITCNVFSHLHKSR